MTVSLPAAAEPGLQQRGADAGIAFEDLHGLTIVADITHEQRIRREGREFTSVYQREWTLVMGPAETFQISFTPMSHAPRKVRGETTRSVAKLGEIRQVRGSGGGQGIWTFRGGALVFLRTYKVGAGKLTIEFNRGADGLVCAASYAFAYEAGKPFIVLDSTFSGKPSLVVADRRLSGHCRVLAQ
jgi:hypothetical protein